MCLVVVSRVVSNNNDAPLTSENRKTNALAYMAKHGARAHTHTHTHTDAIGTYSILAMNRTH